MTHPLSRLAEISEAMAIDPTAEATQAFLAELKKIDVTEWSEEDLMTSGTQHTKIMKALDLVGHQLFSEGFAWPADACKAMAQAAEDFEGIKRKAT